MMSVTFSGSQPKFSSIYLVKAPVNYEMRAIEHYYFNNASEFGDNRPPYFAFVSEMFDILSTLKPEKCPYYSIVFASNLSEFYSGDGGDGTSFLSFQSDVLDQSYKTKLERSYPSNTLKRYRKVLQFIKQRVKEAGSKIFVVEPNYDVDINNPGENILKIVDEKPKLTVPRAK